MRKQNKTNSEPVLLTTVSSNYQLGLVQSILDCLLYTSFKLLYLHG